MIMMVVAPLLLVRGRAGLFLFLYLCAVWLLCLNPLLAPWWMKNIFAYTYFRLVYLLPLPFLCALIAAAGPRLMQRSNAKERAITGAALAAIIDFAKVAGKYIAHAKLLAPTWTAGCEIPLLLPQMKVVAPRLVTHYFSNAGNPQEGILRFQAQAFIQEDKSGKPQWFPSLEPKFRQVIETGRADAVAVPESESERVLATLKSISPTWHRVLEAGGLVLMLPSNTQPEI